MNDKSLLDRFLLKRIEENRKELRHKVDSTLQVEQACLEEIVKGIKHCKTNIGLKLHNNSTFYNNCSDV